jgi:hypothetical protein
MMTMRLSTSAKDGILDSGVDTVFDGCVLELRTGTQPASANSASTGTLLWFCAKTSAFGAASAGAKVATSFTSLGQDAGDAGWFRLRQTVDAGSTDGSDERWDGSVTAAAGGGDLTLDNVSIASGQTVAISALTLSL